MKKCLLPIAILLGMVAAGRAQSPRKLLIQDFTGWLCIPCAQYFPTFRAAIVNPKYASNVAIMAYHTNWSGCGDIMTNDASSFLFNKDHILSIPQYRLNGALLGNYTDGYTGTIDSYLDSITRAPSPITITLQLTRAHGSLHIQGDVSSIATLRGKTLRTEIGENLHSYAHAGSNGEHNFYWICRTVLPDTNGIAIDLAAGGAKAYSFDYAIPNTMTDSALYALTYVADDATGEILQCEVVNPLPLIVDSLPSVIATPSSIANTSITLRNPNAEAAWVTVYADSASVDYNKGWSLVSCPTVSIPVGGSVTIPLSLHASSTAYMGAFPLKIVTSFSELPAQIQSEEMTVSTKTEFGVFTLNDYYVDTGFVYYRDALESIAPSEAATGLLYTMQENSNEPIQFKPAEIPPENFPISVVRLQTYENVWSWPGIRWDSLVARSLEAGKGVLVVGLAGIYTSFGFGTSSALKEMRVRDTLVIHPGIRAVHGIDMDPIGDNISASVMPWDFASTNEITILPGSKAIPILYDSVQAGKRDLLRLPF